MALVAVTLSPERAVAVDMPPAEIMASPSPLKSLGVLPPLLPPVGLPTAPPPDAIKPVEPQAGPNRLEVEPVRTKPGGA